MDHQLPDVLCIINGQKIGKNVQKVAKMAKTKDFVKNQTKQKKFKKEVTNPQFVPDKDEALAIIVLVRQRTQKLRD